MNAKPRHRDTIVVGASAGGVDAIGRLLAQLPKDLSAAVFVVQHQSPDSPRQLVHILQRRSALPVKWAENEDPADPGRVYVAPPDLHMMLSDSRLRVVGGARENRARPSINPLFRSAAAVRGSRTIGVILSGTLDDGVAGLLAIKRCGGVAIVQDPEDARFPEMPRNAVESVDVDLVIPLDRMGVAIVELARQVAPPVEIPSEIALEAALAGPHADMTTEIQETGTQVPMACPECGGPLWTNNVAAAPTFRCHVGHAFSSLTLLESQSEEVERALWAAVRALQERAAMLARLEAGSKAGKRNAALFGARAKEASAQAEQARKFLLEIQRERRRAAHNED